MEGFFSSGRGGSSGDTCDLNEQKPHGALGGLPPMEHLQHVVEKTNKTAEARTSLVQTVQYLGAGHPAFVNCMLAASLVKSSKTPLLAGIISP
jgi:hypothetical protein